MIRWIGVAAPGAYRPALPGHASPWQADPLGGIIVTGAARFGRRTARPHARPAAPLLPHEDSRREAAMKSHSESTRNAPPPEALPYDDAVRSFCDPAIRVSASRNEQKVLDGSLPQYADEAWGPARRDVVERLRRGELHAWARPGSNAEPFRRIETAEWAGVPEKRPDGALLIGGAPYWNVRIHNSGASGRAPDAPGSTAARPRKKGSRDYSQDDAPLVEEMRELVKPSDGRSAITAYEAAGRVAKRARGSSHSNSRQTRLYKRYREKHGTEND